mmetsp:Transcript_40039/g.95136  ORF Transcript_40039/g.95136 Transcript_40039/m.95136 type:complete len:211 (+) Transcript_40039:1013-1645(+)
MSHAVRVVAASIDNGSVVVHGDVAALENTVLHCLAGAHRRAADEEVHALGVLCQVDGLLRGSVPASDHGDLPPPEQGAGAVADGAGGDAVAPEPILARDVEALGRRARRHDDRVRPHRPLGAPHHKRPRRQVDVLDVLGLERRAPPLRLLPHALHEVGAGYSLWEPGKVLDLRGGHELPPADAPRRYAFKNERAKLSPRCIDSCCVACRS